MQLHNAVWIKKLQAIVLALLPGMGCVFRTMQVPSAQPNEGSAATTSHPGWTPHREIPVPLEPAWLSVSHRALSDVIGWVWAPRLHTFFFFALFQGSPLKREPCSRSQRFPPRSDPGPCRTAQQAAGGDRTCPDSAASSQDSPSSSARPARRVLPGQGKLLFVCISQSCHQHRLSCKGMAHPHPVVGTLLGWPGAGRRLHRALLGQPHLSRSSLGSVCWATEAKNPSRENALALFSPCRGHKGTLGFLSGRVKS